MIFFHGEKYKDYQYIRVDTSDASLFEVRYEVPVAGDKYFPSQFIDQKRYASFVNPISEAPFMIVGLRETEHGIYKLITNQLCFEAHWDFSSLSHTYPNEFIGKSVGLLINDIVVVDAVISDRGTLVDKYAYGHFQNPKMENDFFNYCYYQEYWEAGIYHMKLVIEEDSYAWDFSVE